MATCGYGQPSNVTCTKVFGGDGSSFPAAGVNVKGFKKVSAFTSKNLYVAQARQNLTISETKERNVVNGVTLHRYRPANNVLSRTPKNVNFGTGVPVDGVQSLAFVAQFLVYVSFPYYMFGSTSLLENVNIHFNNGSLVTPASLYNENGELHKDIFNKYSTFLDIEPATGKAFNARKRLMASAAVSRKENGKAVTDMLSPELIPEILIPMFWGEEQATITKSLSAKFKDAEKMANMAYPGTLLAIAASTTFLFAGIILLFKRK